MSKRNKVRYQSKGNLFPRIHLTGRVMVKFLDEEALASPVKGDVMLFLSTEKDSRLIPGDYDSMGHAGYVKCDLYDGKEWRALTIGDFFEAREYYYSKTERPIDTVMLCKEAIEGFKGRWLERTYREHYQLVEEEENKNSPD